MTITAADINLSIIPSSDGKRYSRYRDGVIGGGGVLFFEDGFSSGDLSYTQSDASWLSPNTGNTATTGDDIEVVAGRGNPGYALEFTFGGNSDPDDVALAEMRFDLGGNYTEITVEFDLYIPDGTEGYGSAAYEHRDSAFSDNNKLIRLWPDSAEGYSDREKIGCSLFLGDSTDASKVRGEWNVAEPAGYDFTERGQVRTAFIDLDDHGTWVTVKMYCKAATAVAKGSQRIYKNGVLVIDNTDEVDNYNASSPHSWRYGYLLGAANSGFTLTTKLWIDNVKFYAGAV